MLNVGDTFPGINAKDESDNTITNQSLKGTKVVLYFYPKDNTPGCSQEAKDFTTLYSDFLATNTRVIGISKDSKTSHINFKEKLQIPFSLLVDEEQELCRAFGVLKEKSMFGKSYVGIERTTVLFDEQGVIKHIWQNVSVKGHAEAVLNHIKNELS
ncbi:MAG: peroxiredoxin [Legionellales bacterium]|nr:peroxiredoxin [Legionellales bacterium]|tara:strand:- start:24 stop:491 length:468 start_codon:yes stop_codon:yes gene_type:complete